MAVYNINGDAVADVTPNYNEWGGAVASFIGDSITAGTNTTKIYTQYLQEIVGFSACNNYGISGSSISNRNNPMCERYQAVDSSSDIIFVFGGTNDFHFNVPLGDMFTVDGINRSYNIDTSTFRGALNTLCLGLINKFPGKQIVLLTPVHRNVFQQQLTDLQKNSADAYLEDYVDCIKEAARMFSVNVIDLFGYSGLFPYDTNNAGIYYHSDDKLHPGADGHEQIAKIIAEHLKYIPKT